MTRPEPRSAYLTMRGRRVAIDVYTPPDGRVAYVTEGELATLHRRVATTPFSFQTPAPPPVNQSPPLVNELIS